MKYLEIVKYLRNYIPSGEKKWNKYFGLEKIAYFLEKLGNPQEELNFVHVGGTSGKGSTATFLAKILAESGYKTGLHVSPDVITIRERMQINGQCISIDRFKKIFEQIKPIVEKMEKEYGTPPSFYEILLAMSFIYFKEEKCQVVVVEVGVGGKLDSTNVIKCHYQIITNVGLDHTSILGETKELILRDKQEIIKSNSTVVSGIKETELKEIIRQKIIETNSKIEFLEEDFFNKNIRQNKDLSLDFDFESKNNSIKNLGIKLPGLFQVENASLAISMALKMAKEFKSITSNSIRKGVLAAEIPGRFQIFSKNPLGIIDGAHNPDKMAALIKSIKFYFPGQKFITIFRYKKRKDINQSLELLKEISQRIIITSSKKWGDMGWDMSFDSEDEKKLSNKNFYIFESDLKKAYQISQKLLDEKTAGILVTGSLYIIEEFLDLI